MRLGGAALQVEVLAALLVREGPRYLIPRELQKIVEVERPDARDAIAAREKELRPVRAEVHTQTSKTDTSSSS